MNQGNLKNNLNRGHRTQTNGPVEAENNNKKLEILKTMIRKEVNKANKKPIAKLPKELVLVCAFFAVMTFIMLVEFPYLVVRERIEAGVDSLTKHIERDPAVVEFYKANIQAQPLMDIAWLIFRMQMKLLKRFKDRVLSKLDAKFRSNAWRAYLQYRMLLPCAAILFYWSSKRLAGVRRTRGKAINGVPVKNNKTNSNQAINGSQNGVPVKNNNQAFKQSNQLEGVPEVNLKDAIAYKEMMMLAMSDLDSRMKTQHLAKQKKITFGKETFPLIKAISITTYNPNRNYKKELLDLINFFLFLLQATAQRIRSELISLSLSESAAAKNFMLAGAVVHSNQRSQNGVPDKTNQKAMNQFLSITQLREINAHRRTQNLVNDEKLVTTLITELTANTSALTTFNF